MGIRRRGGGFRVGFGIKTNLVNIYEYIFGAHGFASGIFCCSGDFSMRFFWLWVVRS